MSNGLRTPNVQTHSSFDDVLGSRTAVRLAQRCQVARATNGGPTHLHGEEVACRKGIPVILDELVPRGLSRTLRRWCDAVILEDPFDSRLADRVVQIGQCPLDSSVSPSPILLGHALYEASNAHGNPWPPRFAIGAAVVLRGNELAVPAEDRVGRDDGAAC